MAGHILFIPSHPPPHSWGISMQITFKGNAIDLCLKGFKRQTYRSTHLLNSGLLKWVIRVGKPAGLIFSLTPSLISSAEGAPWWQLMSLVYLIENLKLTTRGRHYTTRSNYNIKPCLQQLNIGSMMSTKTQVD